jgi:hypothetical protein
MASVPENLLESVKSVAARGDARGVEELLAGSDATRAAEALATAQRYLYWTHKDVPAVVTVSRAGIAYLLQSSQRLGGAEASDLRHEAKALAYNLGSFMWPGWSEPGIALSAADVAAGFEAARLNLRLAEELSRPEKAKAKAYWLLGAHQLAVAEYGPASESFRSGKTHAGRTDDPSLGRMLDGYLLLTRVLSEPGNAEARRDFDSAVSGLKEDSSEDAREYGNQLTTALAAFGERAQGGAAG